MLSESGLFVMILIFPEVELDPYNVPWGPLKISTRSTSNTCKSGVWPMVVNGWSSN